MQNELIYRMSHAEVRKVAAGFDGIEVSNWGIAYRGDRMLSIQKGGYVYIGKSKVRLDYMVARAFVSNVYYRPVVRHKDGRMENCCAGNLEWVEDVAKVDRSGGRRVVQYSVDGEFLKVWDSVGEAAFELCVPKGRIIEAATGKRKTAAGCLWRWR